MKHALAYGALALAVAASGAAHACTSGSPPGVGEVLGCAGFQQVTLAPSPHTSGGKYLITLYSDGKSVSGSVTLNLPTFTTAFAPICPVFPGEGSAGPWPLPSGFSSGSGVLNGKAVAYLYWNSNQPLGLRGSTEFISGQCY